MADSIPVVEEQEVLVTSTPVKSLPLLKKSIGPVRASSDKRQQRFGHLNTLFALIDDDGSRELTFDEIFGYLNEKNGGVFDRDFAMEIFQVMDKDSSQTVNKQEFITNFVLVEKMIDKRLKMIHITMKAIESRLDTIQDEQEKEDLRENIAKCREEIAFWHERMRQLQVSN